MATLIRRGRARDVDSKQRESYRSLAAKFYGSPLLSRAEVVGRCREAISTRQPFALCKLGPSMLAVLYVMLRDNIDPADPRMKFALFHGYNQAGLFPRDPMTWINYCRRYAEGAAALDVATTLLDLTAIEVTMVRRLRPADVGFHLDGEPDRSVPDKQDLCYLPALAGRRLLIISPFADLLALRAKRDTFEAVWKNTGKPWFGAESVDALTFPYGFSDDAQKQFGHVETLFQHLCSEIDKRSFDVAILGAAGLAVPLAAHIKSRGRIAIDIGGHIQVLFGVKGKRWRKDPVWMGHYFNDSWIDMPAAYRPKAANVCDRGAYW